MLPHTFSCLAASLITFCNSHVSFLNYPQYKPSDLLFASLVVAEPANKLWCVKSAAFPLKPCTDRYRCVMLHSHSLALCLRASFSSDPGSPRGLSPLPAVIRECDQTPYWLLSGIFHRTEILNETVSLTVFMCSEALKGYSTCGCLLPDCAGR